jgi:hypothetical protein
LVESLVKVHEDSRELNREMKILALSRPDIQALRDRNDAIVRQQTLDYMRKYQVELRVDDVEATATVAFTFISAIVDYLVFENPAADRDRIIGVAVEGLYRAMA